MLICIAMWTALVAHAHAQSEELVYRDVDSPQGPVRGYKQNDIFIFHGIPYAKAPTGVDKFKAPLEADTWTVPFEALDHGIICPQAVQGVPLPPAPVAKREQEDCLIATVYAPDTEETALPVVVYVHGGGYQAGWGDMLQPITLTSSNKVVSVTFNYRLGIHGFLCLGMSGAPGNAGMKDIVALLRWVRANIGSYGGNPNDVTIAGSSAGASAVDLIMLSQSATGLYRKVIPDSGANVATWSIQMDPTETARAYARRRNFTNVLDGDALEEFYLSIPLEQLTLEFDELGDRPNSTFGFVPCVEKDIGEDRFLDDTPVNILTNGNYNKVPMLYGFTRMEGLLRIGLFEEWSVRMNERFSDFLPADLQFESEEEKEAVANDVKQFYFGDEPVNEDTVLAFIEYFGDVMFAYPTLRAVKLQVEAGNEHIYLYEYAFVAEEFPSALENVDVRGADHTAQTLIVLDLPLSVQIFHSNRSKEMQVVMRELWLDFMTTGTPVPPGSSMLVPWPPVGDGRSPHMDLDERPQLEGPLLQSRTEFWDNIYDRHYRAPVAPSSASLTYIHTLLGLALLVVKSLL